MSLKKSKYPEKGKYRSARTPSNKADSMEENEDSGVIADQPITATKRGRKLKEKVENIANKDVGNSNNDVQEKEKKLVGSRIKIKQKKMKLHDVLLKKAKTQDIGIYKISQEMKNLNAKVDKLTAVTTKMYEILMELQTSRTTRITLPQQVLPTSHLNNSVPTFNNGMPQYTHHHPNNLAYLNVSSISYYNRQHIAPFPVNRNYDAFHNNF